MEKKTPLWQTPRLHEVKLLTELRRVRSTRDKQIDDAIDLLVHPRNPTPEQGVFDPECLLSTAGRVEEVRECGGTLDIVVTHRFLEDIGVTVDDMVSLSGVCPTVLLGILDENEARTFAGDLVAERFRLAAVTFELIETLSLNARRGQRQDVIDVPCEDQELKED